MVDYSLTDSFLILFLYYLLGQFMLRAFEKCLQVMNVLLFFFSSQLASLNMNSMIFEMARVTFFFSSMVHNL